MTHAQLINMEHITGLIVEYQRKERPIDEILNDKRLGDNPADREYIINYAFIRGIDK